MKKILIVVAILLGLMFSFSNSQQVSADEGTQSSTQWSLYSPPNINRPQDPVEIPGTAFPTFNGLDQSELRAYVFDGSSWVAIPYQLDQRKIDGLLNHTDDLDGTVIDGNDELAFMGGDAGVQASCADSSSLIGADHARHEITVTDPNRPGEIGYVYLFNGTATGLAASPSSYFGGNFTFTPGATSIQDTWAVVDAQGNYNGVSYNFVMGSQNAPTFFGVKDLAINGGPDVLDRQKIRTRIDFPFACNFGLTVNINEEGFVTTGGLDPNLYLNAFGPIRGIADGANLDARLYGGRVDFAVLLDPVALCASGADIDYFRSSFDLNNPAVTGLTQFFANNGGAIGPVPIDGINDAGINGSALFNWYQASGAPGGIAFSVPSLNAGPGAKASHYYDVGPGGCAPTGTGETADTGDGSCYGDGGVKVTNMGNNVLTAEITTYVLPPNPGNVGAAYHQDRLTPLIAAVAPVENCIATVCSAPDDVTVLAPTISGSDPVINWTAVASGADEYVIFRNTTPYMGATATEYATVAGTMTSYTDTATAGDTYYYYVKARNLCGADSVNMSPVHQGLFEFAIVPGV